MDRLTHLERQQLKPVYPVIVRQLRGLRREIELAHLEDGDRHFMSLDAACVLADVCRVLGLFPRDTDRVLGEAIQAMLG